MTAINNSGNINQILTNNLVDVQAGKSLSTANSKKTDDTATEGVVDRVEISNTAITVSKAVDTVKTLPEIRDEVIQKAVQDRIVDNNRVPAEALAAKLLFESN
jgi:hypothetical protein